MSVDEYNNEHLHVEDYVELDSLKPPYSGYTPLPGIIPEVQEPVFTKNSKNGKCVVNANQPIIPVPLTQEVQRKETIVEVEQIYLTDKIIPKVYTQDVYHEIPKLAVDVQETTIDVPTLKINQVQQDIEVPVGINFKVECSWKNRMVPRLFPKFCGNQEVYYIVIPQIEIIDKREEIEVPIYVGEKYVEKEVIEEVGIEKVQYKYVLKEEEVPLYKYRPVFDVEVNIPNPILIPVPIEKHEVNVSTTVMDWNEYRKLRKQNKLNKAKNLGKPIDNNVVDEPPIVIQ